MKTKRNSINRYISILICTVFVFLSCSKNKQSEEKPKSVDIYVAGYTGPINGPSTAKYWKNGVVSELTDGSSQLQTESIYIDNGDVYVVGYEVNPVQSAVYWKNGIKYKLAKSHENLGSHAKAVHVSNGVVHITGVENGKGVYWKNGNLESLPTTQGFTRSRPGAIFVSEDNDIYIAGTGTNDANMSVVKYWKNNTPYVISSSAFIVDVYDMFVTAEDVYIAGYEKSTSSSRDIAKYWKNDIGYPLTDGSKSADAKALFVEQNKVHVVGSEDGVLAYWINGVKQAMNVPSNENSFGESITIINGDVYIAGTLKNAGGYWKNGIWNVLEDIDGSYCDITSLAVIEK